MFSSSHLLNSHTYQLVCTAATNSIYNKFQELIVTAWMWSAVTVNEAIDSHFLLFIAFSSRSRTPGFPPCLVNFILSVYAILSSGPEAAWKHCARERRSGFTAQSCWKRNKKVWGKHAAVLSSLGIWDSGPMLCCFTFSALQAKQFNPRFAVGFVFRYAAVS